MPEKHSPKRNRTRTFSDNELRLVLKPPQPCLRGAAGLGWAGLGSASHFRGTREYLVATVAEASVPAAALGEGAPEAPRGEGGSGAGPYLLSPAFPATPGIPVSSARGSLAPDVPGSRCPAQPAAESAKVSPRQSKCPSSALPAACASEGAP